MWGGPFNVRETMAAERMGLLSEFFRLFQPVTPPAGNDPAALMRWASSFKGLGSADLCRIARAQAAIGDWPSVEFTLIQAGRVPQEAKDALEYRIAAIRWAVDQIRHGVDPPTPPDYEHVDDGPTARPWQDSDLNLTADEVDKSTWLALSHPYQKAAYKGRIEEALTLVRKSLEEAKWISDQAGQFCEIARYQILHGDVDGARRTLNEALDVAMRSSKSNFPTTSRRDAGIGNVATMLADMGDFERAEEVYKLLKSVGRQVSTRLAISYARNNDRPNAVRKLLDIPHNEDRANACVEVVRILINEPQGQTKWPYSTNLLTRLYDYAMSAAGQAGGPTPPGNG